MRQALLIKTTILCLSIFSVLNLHAQNVQVHGKIIDSMTQQPVANATVSSGNQHVLSDAEGSFSINSQQGKTLTISFVGYNSQSQMVTGTDFVNIILSQSSQQLNDVVVTALGV